ncbi:MAG: hypothetical protein P8016_16015 [Sedimentisphaerales bacterium]
MFERDWTSEYYEILEFYFWEPQHLGRAKSSKCRYATPVEALKHVQKMEVSLNHMLNLFFRLAPSEVLLHLIADTTGNRAQSAMHLLSRQEVSAFCQLVQPDLMFQGDSMNFSIEMKLNAKSSLEQAWKYALLHTLADMHNGKDRASYLMFLGKGKFSSLWKENIKSPSELYGFLRNAKLEKFQRKAEAVENISIDWKRVKETLEKTSILYWNYQTLKLFLKEFTEPLVNASGAEQTFVHLINGLLAEIERRKLA